MVKNLKELDIDMAHAKYMDFVFIGSTSGVCAYWLIYLHFNFNVAICLLAYSKLSGFGFFGQVKLVVYCCLEWHYSTAGDFSE